MSSQRNSRERYGNGTLSGAHGRGASGPGGPGAFNKGYGSGLVSLGTAKVNSPVPICFIARQLPLVTNTAEQQPGCAYWSSDPAIAWVVEARGSVIER